MKLIIIQNKNNEFYDYKLLNNQSIIIKNCSNVHFTFDKINKIIIINSHNIYVNIDKIMTSIEVNNSHNIFIKGAINCKIPSIELYKSTLYLIGNNKTYKDILIFSEVSNFSLLF
jgi:hypothetical protein